MRKDSIYVKKSKNTLLNILVVEDNEYRLAFFEKYLKPFSNLTIFTEAKSAIEKVKEQKFNLIFLDHDLGGEVYVDSNKSNTGFQVAKAILQSKNKKTKVIVHSLNLVGVNNICNILPHAERFPFGLFLLNFENNQLIVKRRILGDL